MADRPIAEVEQVVTPLAHTCAPFFFRARTFHAFLINDAAAGTWVIAQRKNNIERIPIGNGTAIGSPCRAALKAPSFQPFTYRM
jgi:hypothetical protein